MKVLKTKYATSKNLHLAISVAFILPIGLAYGLYPNTVLSKLFDFTVETADLANIFRAMMGLYLGMSSLWIAGIIKPAFWITATISNIVFMGGLALGRCISLAADGLPAIYLLIGVIIELTLAFWGLKNLKKYKSNLIK